MKFLKSCLVAGSLLLLTLTLGSCANETQKPQQEAAMAQETAQPVAQETVRTPAYPSTLPVSYQTPSYVVNKNETADITIAEESKLKVGARITSTKGPQPLWDIVKRLAALKGMNVSWASDVDKNVLVDVDINANDDFYEALDSMLRQVDYFHEMDGNTIVIKYKETRQFQIAMPFTKQNYTTSTGGNLLGGASSEGQNLSGTVQLDSKDNQFDIWENIKLNLDTILQIWTFRREGETVKKEAKTVDEEVAKEGSRNYSGKKEMAQSQSATENTAAEGTKSTAQTTGDVSGGQGFYIIDKPVGLITVTAPRRLLEKVDAYITTLKKSLYQQISIEAKILEVQLNDASSIGINWTNVLKDFDISGTLEFGQGGVVHPGTGQFVSRILLNDRSFDVLLNALKQEGDTKILSNPRISVMNGQPAMITVGENVTYIDNIKSDTTTSSGSSPVVTFTVETQRILSGVGLSLTATILGKNEIIMNLVPLTSELQEPIEYQTVGNQGGIVGLPRINVREMSTTVKVKGGEMLVIGGLISDTNQKTGEFAPGFGNIPGLRYFFGHEDKQHIKSELIILLRPKII